MLKTQSETWILTANVENKVKKLENWLKMLKITLKHENWLERLKKQLKT